jgi:putative ABC transport system permease protein
VRSGITRHALRRHRWSLLGPAVTQATAATVISMMVMTATSLDAAPLAPAERAALEATTVPESTLVFTLIAVYLSVILVGVTMNLTIATQVRDIALLRAIGATPGRIRRSVALQAAIVAVPSAALGYLTGIAAGYAWTAALQAHGVIPPAVTFRVAPLVLPMVIGIEVATSVAGALVAAIRPARIRPALALTEAATRRPAVGVPRIVAGLVLVAGGVALSAVIARTSPDDAAENAFFVLLAMCVGVGVLGPVLLRAVVAVVRPVTTASARLAVDNVGAMSRALSGALVPLVLVIAFAAVKVAMHTTPAHRTGAGEPAGDVWTDYSGTVVYCAFAAIAALSTLITVLVGRRRDLAVAGLAGGTRQRVLAVVVCEAVLVTATALGLAAAIATATLLPILRTAPYVPPAYLVVGVLLAAAVVAAGMVVPAAVLTRRRPITVVAAAVE